MFHTYVKAQSGRQIDFDRARYLMDDDLFHAANKALIERICPGGFTPFDVGVAERMGFTTEVKVQRVWNDYCARHRQKYGASFEPDISPTWDS